VSDPAGRFRPADGVFGKEDARVGAVITSGFTLPDTRCGPRRRSFSGYSLQAKLAPGAGLSRAAHGMHLTRSLAYRIGSSIPVPGIDPAAFERVMALEDHSVPL
jgi:hypothetical protein